MIAYRNTHLWLMVPLVVVVLGFVPSYWLRFFEVPWRHHVHGLTATLWFILLIAQPYLISRGRADQHRRFGMLALILAGAVAASGINLIPYNLTNNFMPEVARYGLSFVDIVLVPGFAVAVCMGVVTSRRLNDHARWMLSTVFWAVSPALFRLILFPLLIADVDGIDTKIPWILATTGIVNLVVLTVLMARDRRIHPAYALAFAGSFVLFVPMLVGNMPWWRSFADAVFTL